MNNDPRGAWFTLEGFTIGTGQYDVPSEDGLEDHDTGRVYHFYMARGQGDLLPFLKISWATLYMFIQHLELWAYQDESQARRNYPPAKRSDEYKQSLVYEKHEHGPTPHQQRRNCPPEERIIGRDAGPNDRYKKLVIRDGLTNYDGFQGRQGPLDLRHWSEREKRAQFGLDRDETQTYFNPSILDPYKMDVHKQVKDLNTEVRTVAGKNTSLEIKQGSMSKCIDKLKGWAARNPDAVEDS